MDPACLTDRTINQDLSMKQGGCRTKDGRDCVAEVWKNQKGRWYQVRSYLTDKRQLSLTARLSSVWDVPKIPFSTMLVITLVFSKLTPKL